MQRNESLVTVLIAALASGVAAAPALAAEVAPELPVPSYPVPTLTPGAHIEMTVPLFKSRVVSVVEPANRVSVGNPDTADIVVISPSQLYVLGKDIGNTNVLIWDHNNHLIGTINVTVQHDLEELKRKLAEVLPGEAIEVRSAKRAIVLSGRVSDAEKMDAAVRIADAYLEQIQTAVHQLVFKQKDASHREDKAVGAVLRNTSGVGGEQTESEVINLLQVGGVQQVMIEVKVSEMQRTEVRNLDAQFNSISNGSTLTLGGVNGGATFPPFINPQGQMEPALSTYTNASTGGLPPGYCTGGCLTRWGPPVADFLPNPMSIANQGLFGSFLDKGFMFNLALSAALQQGLAKILAEPNLTTTTGQEAKFLSGGQFPIPVVGALGQTGIEYKDYGVQLDFIPVVLSNGHINLKLNISVSELAQTSALGVSVTAASSTFVIPSLTVRSASGTVELRDGQTIGLAGLLNDNLTQAITKFPGLGDLPILGALFRSQSYQKGDTELVILVTPHLAKPVNKDRVKLPTDSFVDPSKLDFYLWGKMEGTAPASQPDTTK
jgi:pilus assembly protein CpaC